MPATLAVPRRIISQFDADFKMRPSALNDFNTGLGVLHSSLMPGEYRAFQSALAIEGLQLPDVPSEGLLEFIKLNIGVEPHTDPGYGRLKFFMWVLDSKKMEANASRFDSRALFRYCDHFGKKEEIRLTPGMLIGFNQNRKHELCFFGEEVKLAVGVATKLGQKSNRLLP